MDANELANKLRSNPNNESSYIEDVIKWCDENAEKLNLSNPDEMFLCEKATRYLMENKVKRSWSKEDAKYVVNFLAKKTMRELNLNENVEIHVLEEDEYIKLYGEQSSGICVPKGNDYFNVSYSPNVIKYLTSNNKGQFLHGLQIVFHEIRHVHQNKSIKNETREDGTELPKSKERYLSVLETLARRQDSKFYKKNYRQLLKENDADKYGLIMAYETLCDYAPNLRKQYNSKEICDLLHEYDRNYYEALSNISETMTLKTEIETRATIYIMAHPEVLQEFPILNIAFNKDGSKRDILELLEGRNELLESNQNAEMINELYRMIIDNRNPTQGGLKGTKDEFLKLVKYIQETGTEDKFIYDVIEYKLKHKTKMTQEQIDSYMGKLHDKASKSRQKRDEEQSIRDEVGDEFQPKTEAQQQERKAAETKWMQRIGSVAQEVDKTIAGVQGKKEVVKLTQELQAREKQKQEQEQVKLQEEQQSR